jgi:hypothetical protein
MAIDGVRKYIEAPVATPLPYGLISVVDVIPDSDPHWRLGTKYQPDACERALSTRQNCPLDALQDTPTKSPSVSGIETIGNDTFTLYTRIDCSPVGAWDEYQRRTEEALDFGAGRTIERVFESGVIDAPGVDTYYPHLASNTDVFDTEYQTDVLIQTAATVAATGTFSVVEAIGLLEGAMGECYGGTPVIHTPRVALAQLDRYGLVYRRDDMLVTLGGSRVVSAPGYRGLAPDGTDPAYPIVWFYATGAIHMRVSETKFTSSREEGLRRDINSMVLIAERTYSLGWDCCHFAVQVDLSI